MSNEIEVTLVDKSFLFIDDLNLSKGQKTKVNLESKSDAFLSTVAQSIALGILISETNYRDIIKLIESEEVKLEVKRNLGILKEEFNDKSTVQEEVQKEEKVIEPKKEESSSSKIEDKQEETSNDSESSSDESVEDKEEVRNYSDDKLAEMLKGNNKTVSKGIVSSNEELELSEADKTILFELESNDKNRKVVLSVIEGL